MARKGYGASVTCNGPFSLMSGGGCGAPECTQIGHFPLIRMVLRCVGRF